MASPTSLVLASSRFSRPLRMTYIRKGLCRLMLDDTFWPPPGAFLDLSSVKQLTDGRARCVGVAICDDDGHPTSTFRQGQRAHFFYEFEVLGEIGVPSGGLELHNS